MKYDPSFVARIRDLRYLGAKNIEIARLFGISVQELLRWKADYPAFAAAWEDGSMHADSRVAAALFKRACGYDHEVTKETKDGTFAETKHYPADVSACIFWLTNRNPHNWSSKVEFTGNRGGETENLLVSDLELARRIAFALNKALLTGDSLPQPARRSLIYDNDTSAPSETE